jgi:F-type H+-transporting ATPase subunit delta
VTPASVARRYAAALFDVSSRAGVVDRAGRDLGDVRDLLVSHDELRRVFETPAVPAARKRAIVDALVTASSDLSGEVARLLELLADRDRLMLLPAIAESYEARANAARRVVPADVVTAVPLSDDRQAALARALGRATGGEVTLSARVDPSIIGGVVARVGSVVFDGSVTRQIERLRERLLAGV